jgi:hypothetical protein
LKKFLDNCLHEWMGEMLGMEAAVSRSDVILQQIFKVTYY